MVAEEGRDDDESTDKVDDEAPPALSDDQTKALKAFLVQKEQVIIQFLIDFLLFRIYTFLNFNAHVLTFFRYLNVVNFVKMNLKEFVNLDTEMAESFTKCGIRNLVL